MANRDRLQDILTKADAKLIVAMEAAISDSRTPEDQRAGYREELGSIAHGYANLDLIDDEDWAEFCGPNRDTLTDEAYAEFINRAGVRR